MAKQKQPVDPLVASLMPESDKKFAGVTAISVVVALALSAWASMYEAVVDEVMFEENNEQNLQASMKIEDKKEEKKEEKEEKKPEQNRKRAGGGGKPRGKGVPNAPQTRGVLKLPHGSDFQGELWCHDLMKDQKFTKDIDKVLKDVAGLQTTGKTVLGGRRGKADGGFNEGYAEGGNGLGDGLAGLLGGSGGAGGTIATKTKGSIKTPSERDIDMGAGGGSRSAADIMRVVRQRTPGLRHIYNKFLKTKPGFAGR